MTLTITPELTERLLHWRDTQRELKEHEAKAFMREDDKDFWLQHEQLNERAHLATIDLLGYLDAEMEANQCGR